MKKELTKKQIAYRKAYKLYPDLDNNPTARYEFDIARGAFVKGFLMGLRNKKGK